MSEIELSSSTDLIPPTIVPTVLFPLAFPLAVSTAVFYTTPEAPSVTLARIPFAALPHPAIENLAEKDSI